MTPDLINGPPPDWESTWALTVPSPLALPAAGERLVGVAELVVDRPDVAAGLHRPVAVAVQLVTGRDPGTADVAAGEPGRAGRGGRRGHRGHVDVGERRRRGGAGGARWSRPGRPGSCRSPCRSRTARAEHRCPGAAVGGGQRGEVGARRARVAVLPPDDLQVGGRGDGRERDGVGVGDAVVDPPLDGGGAAGVEVDAVHGRGGAGAGPHHQPVLGLAGRAGLGGDLGADRLVARDGLVDVVHRVRTAAEAGAGAGQRQRAAGAGGVAGRGGVAEVGAGPAGRARVGGRGRRHGGA